MYHTYIFISPITLFKKIARVFWDIIIPLPFNLLRNKEQGTRNKEQGTRNKEQGTCTLHLSVKLYRLIHWCFRAEVNIIPDSLFHTIPFKELTPSLVRWQGKPPFW